MNFSTPVAITANTIYVASYHSTLGHYAADQNYFASSGVDNPPLHAVQNTGGVLNGVFGYGTSSVFPTSSFNASNYWVDVAFKPASTLSSIAVTPANASIAAGSTQQFTATGTLQRRIDGQHYESGGLVVFKHSRCHHELDWLGYSSCRRQQHHKSGFWILDREYQSHDSSGYVGGYDSFSALSCSKRHLLRVAICSGWHRTL